MTDSSVCQGPRNERTGQRKEERESKLSALSSTVEYGQEIKKGKKKLVSFDPGLKIMTLESKPNDLKTIATTNY